MNIASVEEEEEEEVELLPLALLPPRPENE